MANTILTADVIVKAANAMFESNTPFLQSIDRQYDRSYEVAGAKEGDTVRIMRPIKATTRTGKTAQVQNRTEESVNLAVTNQIGVDMKFSSAELAQDIEPFTKKTLMPYISTLTSTIESNIMASAYQATYQSVGTPGTDPATWLVYGQAAAKLDNMNANQMGRSVVLNPNGRAATVNGLTGLFNPQREIGKQYISGNMGPAAGFDFNSTPNVRNHTVGAIGDNTALVNDTVANGDAVISMDDFSNATPSVTAGDVFTIAGVNAVNPLTKQSTGELQQFVVTAAKTGSSNAIADVAISPTIYSTGPLQNVDALPADDAAITFVGTASTAYTQNLAYQERAFTFATADLPLYGNTDFESRDVHNGVSMRIEKVVDGINDDVYYRLDVLYGFAAVVPEWACRIQGA